MRTRVHAAERWFYLFLIIHLLVWTIVPTIARHNLPLDSMEGTLWGHQLEWGYDKNPFLNAWLTALAVKISGESGWAIYLFSQISVVLCFWAVWQFAKRILLPYTAVLAVMLLEALQYYNFHAIDFNDNTLELSLWLLSAWFFYVALKENKLWSWFMVGFAAGLGMLDKYYTAIFLLVLLVFLLFYAENRKYLRCVGPYVSLTVLLAIVLPHIIWLTNNNFITIQYAVGRVGSAPSLFNHFYYPLEFLIQQIEVLLPLFILFFALRLFAKGTAQQLPLALRSLSPFDRRFIYWVGLCPLLFTVLLSVITGIKLRAGWGQPLLSFSGILLLLWLQPRISARQFYRFISLFYFIFAMTVIIYGVSIYHGQEPATANFPGKEVATTVTKIWHDTYHRPLQIVAGERWLAGNVAFYSKDQPSVFIEGDMRLSPWINLKKLNQAGTVFVWNAKVEGVELPDWIAEAFIVTHVMVVHVQPIDRKNYPVELGMAFLSPKRGLKIS